MTPLRVTALLCRRPALTVVVLLLTTAAALLAASRLRPSTDLESLLPDESPAATAYLEYLERFGGFERVFVLIRFRAGETSEDSEQTLLEAAWAVEEELSGRPGIASVRSGLQSSDQDFFLEYLAPRAVFLLPEDSWLETLRARLEPAELESRAEILRAQVALPGRDGLLPLLQSDPLGLLEEVSSLSIGSGLPLDPWTSTFFSPPTSTSPAASLVVVTPTSSELDPDSGQRLLRELEGAFDRARSLVDADLEMLAIGGPLYAVQDEELIKKDLTATLATSVTGCVLVLFLAFGGLTLPFLTLATVLVGLIWLGATLALGYGAVSALSLGFAAVLVGLGVDYGIHLATRYRESSLGDPAGDKALRLVAWEQTAGGTWRAITVSAWTTAAAFSVLRAAHLAPLRELGAVVGLGMVFLWISALVVGGFLLVCFGGRAASRPGGILWRALGRMVDGSVQIARRRPATVLILATLASLVALPGILGLRLDTDLRALRPQPSPIEAAERALSESFGVGADTATVLVPGNHLGTALEQARQVTRLLRRALPETTELSTPAELVALGPEVERRLGVLATLPIADAADRLETELRSSNLNPEAFRIGLDGLRSLGRGQDPGLPDPEAWPEWLSGSISVADSGQPPETTADRSADDTIRDPVASPPHSWVAIHLRLAKGVWQQGPPEDLVEQIEVVAPGTLIAASGAVAVELSALARSDLRRLAALGLGVVALVVWLGLGCRLLSSLLAVVPVLLGTLWTFGTLGWAGGSLDLISLSFVPILLGIGIDDGLHAVTGSEHSTHPESRPASPFARSVQSAGRAISLTTLTTAVGFGSLLFSSLPGLRKGGAALAGGVVFCLLATLFVLPAIESLIERRTTDS